jgi:selenide,water dikinase
VDDPYTFGQIAAANSVSDIYAMGGKPLTALSIIGFPIETMSHRIMNQILRGGVDKMEEAGVSIVGGHSIKDNEVKFGFAVTGTIHPEKIITNDKAQSEDILVLTKPLGTGVIGFASQIGKASAEALNTISQSMAELNKIPAEIMVDMGVKTATDVTGFGLLGHLSEIAAQSKVTVEIFVNQVPFFDGVFDYIRQGMISGAIERNKEFASQYVTTSSGVSEEREIVLYDPQTSGGLLIAINPNDAEELISRLKKKGIDHSSIIGKVVSKSDGQIILKNK